MIPLAEAHTREISLDPATPKDWRALRELGHRMLDDMLDHLATLDQQPAWQPIPDAVRHSLTTEALPIDPQPADAVYTQFLHEVLPYTSGNRHPRAWGWVRGPGTPLAMLADMLASGINAHLAGGEQAPVLIEEQCLEWLRQLMRMPEGASGVLTSGGTMANLLGLTVARNTHAPFAVRKEGLQGEHPRLRIYGSTETHMWAQKAVEMLGLGSDSFRRIAVDPAGQIELAQLEREIAKDRAAGYFPLAVIGNLGTVNTGAIDDLPALAALCRRENLWFHVDGAFGALLALSPAYASLTAGMEQADSLAFDLHKWMYLPFGIGCVLVRDARRHRAAFATEAAYLEGSERGMLAGGIGFSDRGIELTRSFKALKLWMSLKTHGAATFGRLIEQNVEQAAYLESLIDETADMERLAPRRMNVVCFRAHPKGVDSPEALNRLNRELLLRLQESGRYMISGTQLGSTYALRVANTNHRSRQEDFAGLVRDVAAWGREIAADRAYQNLPENV